MEHGHVYVPTPPNEFHAGALNAGSWDVHRGMYFDCLEKISAQSLLRKVGAYMLGRTEAQGEVIVAYRVEACNHPRNRRLMDSSGRVVPSGAIVAVLYLVARLNGALQIL